MVINMMIMIMITIIKMVIHPSILFFESQQALVYKKLFD